MDTHCVAESHVRVIAECYSNDTFLPNFEYTRPSRQIQRRSLRAVQCPRRVRFQRLRKLISGSRECNALAPRSYGQAWCGDSIEPRLRLFRIESKWRI